MSMRNWKHEGMAGRDDPRAKDLDWEPKEMEMCFIDPPALSSTPHLQLWDPAGFAINDGDEIQGYAVDVLGTAAVKNFVRSQDQEYWFELELRPFADRFSGQPTHASGRMTIRADASITFPRLGIVDLVPNAEYKWVARLATNYCHCIKGETDNWECSERRVIVGHWIHGGTFRTGADRTWQALSIESAQVTLGTAISGNEASLLNVDSNYYEVGTTTRKLGGFAVHMAEVEVRFTAIPEIRHLRARFVGHAAPGTRFSLLLLQNKPPAIPLWVNVINNAPLGAADDTLDWTTEPSLPEDVWCWIGGNGLISVRMRVVAHGGAGAQFATDALTVEALAPV